MLIRKTFRYRVYPTAQQQDRLAGWQNAMRFLWNIANEQRLMGLSRPRDERVFVALATQMKELTDLRSELPWLRDVPCDVSQHMLTRLDLAWQRCFQRISRAPRWKKKNDVPVSLTEPHPKAWRIGSNYVRFPKIGNIRAVMHRPIEGKRKCCTLVQRGDQWFVLIVCEIEIPDPQARSSPAIALDRGITNIIADSEGNITTNPRYYERAMKRLARAQRVMSRRKKGSKNRDKAKLRVMRMHRKIQRQRAHFVHTLSTRLAKSHGVVVIEKLSASTMMRGTRSRGIGDAGWAILAQFLRYKLAWSGGTLIEAPAHYSSQTCAACGHIDARSRRGEHFCCTSCGYVDHADLNAAKVLLTRANRSGLPMEGSVPKAARRSGKVTPNMDVMDYASK